MENHRDKGRARYWRVSEKIEVSSPSSSSTSEETVSVSAPSWANDLPDELSEMLSSGSDFRFVKVGETASDAVNARNLILDLAKMYGVEIDIPFTFTPGGIFVISRPRK